MTSGSDNIRVMWLLNHRTARNFDVAMLQSLGIREIFLPKSFPADPRYVSADVDRSLDSALTIPRDDLALLNGTDWYDGASAEAWEIANRHFQIAFVGFHPRQIDESTRHFNSVVLVRAFGHLASSSFFSDAFYREMGLATVQRIGRMNERFWFAQAYEHLHEAEHWFLRRRSCYLPLGLADAAVPDQWRGEEAKILFVCPQIRTEPYYERMYGKFRTDFRGLPCVIAGAQPIRVLDPDVLGFVPREQHEQNMRRCRVMFYPGAHPYHVHYHPFEAVHVGMPLVFMAGGLLDRLGGEKLPGRCRTLKEARWKIERLLSGDSSLAERIRESQPCLLDKMTTEYCAPIWRRNFEKVLAPSRGAFKRTSKGGATPVRSPARRRPKIAIVLPQGYRGGTLRAIKLIAAALHVGSRRVGEPADIVLAHLEDRETYPDREFHDLLPGISRRPFAWKLLDREAAERACRYQGHEVALDGTRFLVPDDGINSFVDCDLWLVISDRLTHPLLPVRPYALIVFDYIQRYQPILSDDDDDIPFLHAARSASAVIVTTRFTRDDAAQYAGVDPHLIHVVPHVLPDFPEPTVTMANAGKYFLWPTNAAAHKNHVNSLHALRFYYEELDGSLQCWITGVNSHALFSGKYPHLEQAKALFDSNPTLRRNLVLCGELPDPIYQRYLAGARFLWHTAVVDNGTFAAIEAASLGIPVLSSRYPAMQEMNESHDLNAVWLDSNEPRQMALQLRRMEADETGRRQRPSRQSLQAKSREDAATAYWRVVRECL
jgi:glycosyltransferase involved in cell wall biosynthesis